jgi:hypothetical protein
MKRFCFALSLSAILMLISVQAFAYPTSCNIIPTADILSPGLVRLEYENDGMPRIGATDAIAYGFTQMGLTPRLEFGVDRYDLSGEPQNSLNVKYLAMEETASAPALAVGLLDMAEDSPTSYYAIGMKSFGDFRLHAGYIHADYSRGVMLGCDQKLGESTYFLSDWMPDSENFFTLGLYQEIGKEFALTFTYGFPNDSEASKLVAINLAYTFGFSHGGAESME